MSESESSLPSIESDKSFESDILQPGYDDPDCDPYRSLFRYQRKLCELFFLRFDPVGPAESMLTPREGLEVQLEVRLSKACSFFL